MTGINLEWDWGVTANSKLAELFETEEQIDFFCDYILQQMPLDDVVWHMLRYTPEDVLKQIATDIGTYKLEVEDANG
jgi:hypothetical protein